MDEYFIGVYCISFGEINKSVAKNHRGNKYRIWVYSNVKLSHSNYYYRSKFEAISTNKPYKHNFTKGINKCILS